MMTSIVDPSMGMSFGCGVSAQPTLMKLLPMAAMRGTLNAWAGVGLMMTLGWTIGNIRAVLG